MPTRGSRPPTTPMPRTLPVSAEDLGALLSVALISVCVAGLFARFLQVRAWFFCREIPPGPHFPRTRARGSYRRMRVISPLRDFHPPNPFDSDWHFLFP